MLRLGIPRFTFDIADLPGHPQQSRPGAAWVEIASELSEAHDHSGQAVLIRVATDPLMDHYAAIYGGRKLSARNSLGGK